MKAGIYKVRFNPVYLYVSKDRTIKAIAGANLPHWEGKKVVTKEVEKVVIINNGQAPYYADRVSGVPNGTQNHGLALLQYVATQAPEVVCFASSTAGTLGAILEDVSDEEKLTEKHLVHAQNVGKTDVDAILENVSAEGSGLVLNGKEAKSAKEILDDLYEQNPEAVRVALTTAGTLGASLVYGSEHIPAHETFEQDPSWDDHAPTGEVSLLQERSYNMLENVSVERFEGKHPALGHGYTLGDGKTLVVAQDTAENRLHVDIPDWAKTIEPTPYHGHFISGKYRDLSPEEAEHNTVFPRVADLSPTIDKFEVVNGVSCLSVAPHRTQRADLQPEPASPLDLDNAAHSIRMSASAAERSAQSLAAAMMEYDRLVYALRTDRITHVYQEEYAYNDDATRERLARERLKRGEFRLCHAQSARKHKKKRDRYVWYHPVFRCYAWAKYEETLK